MGEDSRLCEDCGCGLGDRRRGARFCSAACRQRTWYAIRKCKDGSYEPRQCRGCRARFLPTHAQQRFHSARCEDTHRQRRQRERRLGPLERVRCRGCGVRFSPWRRGLVFCEPRCGDAYRKRLAYRARA